MADRIDGTPGPACGTMLEGQVCEGPAKDSYVYTPQGYVPLKTEKGEPLMQLVEAPQQPPAPAPGGGPAPPGSGYAPGPASGYAPPPGPPSGFAGAPGGYPGGGGAPGYPPAPGGAPGYPPAAPGTGYPPAPAAPGGYGAPPPPPGGSYGAPPGPYGGGYGAPPAPPGGGYGRPDTSGDAAFAASLAAGGAGGYGAPPPAPPPAAGYGAPPPHQGGYVQNMSISEKRMQAQSAFHRFDADRSGFIDNREFVQAMQVLGFRGSAADAGVIFTMVDIDGDGRVRENEFVEHWVANH